MVIKMEGSTQYSPSAGSGSAGTSSKIAQFSGFSRISDEDPSDKSTTSKSGYSRSVFRCLPLFPRPRPRPQKAKRRSVTSTAHVAQRKALRASTVSTLPATSMNPSIEATPYNWPHNNSFDPKTTALVVVDMQNDFCSKDGYMAFQGYPIDDTLAIIPRIQKLIHTFRTHSFPIYWTREGHRPDLSTLSTRELLRSQNNSLKKGIGDSGPLGRLLVRGSKGHEIVDELKPSAEEEKCVVIDKPGRSAFQHTDFGLLLSIKGIKNLVLCGVTTDVCVHSTMREANDNAFDCLLVEDATAASERHLHVGAVESVKAEGGIFGAVSTTDNILAALGVGNVDEVENVEVKINEVPRISSGVGLQGRKPSSKF